MVKKRKLEPVISIGLDEIPLPSTYGAAELKFFIRRNTYRGALITLLLLLAILLLTVVSKTVEESTKREIKVAPITKMTLDDLPPPDAEATSDIPPPPDVVINTGPAARAGNPIPVPDAMIAPDVKDFATVDVQSRASTVGGEGEDLGQFAANIDWTGESRKVVEVETIKDKEPEPDEFVPVEKEPVFDIGKLMTLVNYPEMARKANIEGTVHVRALVNREGKIVRAFAEMSDNKALDKAAIDAVLKYGYATPAVMNGQPVSCWVSIPIVFKLK